MEHNNALNFSVSSPFEVGTTDSSSYVNSS